jgi:hypothetical protein
MILSKKIVDGQNRKYVEEFQVDTSDGSGVFAVMP